jgi:transposase
MKKIVFSNKEIVQIMSLYLSGLSCIEIGKKFNVSKTPIKKILQEKKILRSGNSNGKKIEISEKLKKEIHRLYTKENCNIYSISKKTGLSAPFVDKFLQNSGFRRSKAEATKIAKTGVKLSEKTILKMILAQRKISLSGNKKLSGGVCKVYNVGGVTCTGTYEKFYLEKMIKEFNIFPINCKPVITPFGAYYPDFEVDGSFVEIKSEYTYDVLIGKTKNKWSKKFDTLQIEKIRWVNENLKKVEVIVVDKKQNKLFKKNI